ncbi:MAG: single-stranded DNA-binding protein [Chloroflexi bacterium]|nr:single-stranded DNA-binding protein [Chloroflexota bacterium]
MASLNKIMIIGNLGTSPEMRYTPMGTPITSFRMATSRFYTTQDGERRQETEWFTVVARNRLAETCNQFLIKGKRVYVEGRLRSHTWEGPDGQSRFRNEIMADRILFLDRQPIAGGPPAAVASVGEDTPDMPTDDVHFGDDKAGL